MKYTDIEAIKRISVKIRAEVAFWLRRGETDHDHSIKSDLVDQCQRLEYLVDQIMIGGEAEEGEVWLVKTVDQERIRAVMVEKKTLTSYQLKNGGHCGDYQWYLADEVTFHEKLENG